MTELPTPRAIELRARAAGTTVASLLRRADLAPSVFTRWKQGKAEPKLSTVRRMLETLDAIERQRKAAAGEPPLLPLIAEQTAA